MTMLTQKMNLIFMYFSLKEMCDLALLTYLYHPALKSTTTKRRYDATQVLITSHNNINFVVDRQSTCKAARHCTVQVYIQRCIDEKKNSDENPGEAKQSGVKVFAVL